METVTTQNFNRTNTQQEESNLEIVRRSETIINNHN